MTIQQETAVYLIFLFFHDILTLLLFFQVVLKYLGND